MKPMKIEVTTPREALEAGAKFTCSTCGENDRNQCTLCMEAFNGKYLPHWVPVKEEDHEPGTGVRKSTQDGWTVIV